MRNIRSRRHALALAGVVLAAVAATLQTPQAAVAVNDQTLSGTKSPMWQTNNTVRAMAVRNGVLYAGGDFTQVRPPGAALGTQSTNRSYLAAFNTTTGNLITTFNVTLNGPVNDLAISPDGTKLFLAGNFTTVGTTARNRVAAINLPNGTLNAFTANANAAASAIAVTANTVFVGGDFTTIKSTAKQKMASIAYTNNSAGTINAGFTANIDVRPGVIVPTPDGTRLLIGGGFTTLNGAPPSGMASVVPATGALQTWNANSIQPINQNCTGRVTDIVTQGNMAYVTAEGDPPGCYEGTYEADMSNDGTLIWNSSCLGASQGLVIVGAVLYKASHQHDCSLTNGGAAGGFVGGVSLPDFVRHHLVGQNLATGNFVHWTPDTNSSTGPNPIGPHVLATDGTQLFVGGDFSKVETLAQQGLTRFGTGNNVQPKQPATVYVQPTAAGTLTVTWPSTFDLDTGDLTYSIFRDGSNTRFATATSTSYPWNRPVLRLDDRNLVPGSVHSYRISASDGTLSSVKSVAVSATVPTGAPAAYASTVTGLNPALYWRLDDSGATAADSSSTAGNPGSYQGTAANQQNQQQAGALSNDTAATFDGSTGFVGSTNPLPAMTSFTESAWFKTSSVTGGTIVAMSDSSTGAGTGTDRGISMDNNGNVVFAIKGVAGTRGARVNSVRLQGPIYNDNRWHQVVGTYDSGTTTMSLYTDGELQGTLVAAAGGMATAYQRVGYADLSGLKSAFGINFFNQQWPTSFFFAGSIDEVATYPVVLTDAQIKAQFASQAAGL